MLKVTIYDGPMGMETSYIEGVTEPGGTRKVRQIMTQGDTHLVIFDNGEEKRFNGFRSILDTINDPERTENK